MGGWGGGVVLHPIHISGVCYEWSGLKQIQLLPGNRAEELCTFKCLKMKSGKSSRHAGLVVHVFTKGLGHPDRPSALFRNACSSYLLHRL